MKAMIFAAGMGTRLGDITRDNPKALVEINGKSVLERAVENLTGQGFDDIIVNIHHYADKVENSISQLRNKGYRITISDERSHLLETGGGLQKAGWFFGKEPFLVYNSDVITDFDLLELYNHHKKEKGIATLAVIEREDSRCFLIDGCNTLAGWKNSMTGEKVISRQSSEKLTEAAFCGIHVMDPKIFRFMRPGVYSLTSLYLVLAGKERINAYYYRNGYWIDIGNIDDLRSAEEYLSSGSGIS
jgi:NDP-sugar pyrophosphorylase family protein